MPTTDAHVICSMGLVWWCYIMFLGLRTVNALGTRIGPRTLTPLTVARQGKFRGGAAFASAFDFPPPSVPTSKEVSLSFESLNLATLEESPSVVIIGRSDILASALTGGLRNVVDVSISDAMLKSRKAGDSGVTVSSWLPTPSGKPRHLSLVHALLEFLILK